MADTQARRDPNRIPSLIGVDSITFEDTQTVAVNSDHEMLVAANVTISGLPTAVTDGEAVDVADTGNLALGTDGSNYQILKTDSSGELQIDVLTSALPTGAATLAEQQTQTTALQLIDNAISGNEMQVDVVAALPAGDNNIGNVDIVSGTITTVSTVTSVTAIANALPSGTNAVGKLLPPDIDVTGHTNYARKYYTSAGAATDGIIWSPAAGKRWHVVTLYLNVSAASTVTLEDDKGAGDDPVWKGELAANSGVVLQFPEKYPMASGEDAADLLITTTAGNVYVTCVGYEI